MNGVKKAIAAFSLVLLSFIGVPAASAHTEIDHTTPGDGSSVAAGTQTISVVFTDKILNLDNSSEVVIAAADGSEVPTSCIEVKDKSIQVEAFLGSEGDYKVTWRTVAEDGHPISGNFGFTVTGTAENTDFVSCKMITQEDTPTVIATPKAMAAETSEVAESNESGSSSWLLFGGPIAGVVVGLTINLLRRKRAKTKE